MSCGFTLLCHRMEATKATLLVRKRDGTHVPFDPTKILAALRHVVDIDGDGMAEEVLQHVTKKLEGVKELGNKDAKVLTIDAIQDEVECTLVTMKFPEAAKKYILYRHTRDHDRCAESVVKKIVARVLLTHIDVPWGPLGYVTFKRTYSRMSGTKRMEEFQDALTRVLIACQTQLRVNFTNDELERVFRYMYELKFSVAGRFLWQLGTKTVERLGLSSLQNCAFVKIDSLRAFPWLFDMLMLGVGVGFSIQRHHVACLPPVLDSSVTILRKDTKDADFIVPDSREGWVSLLEHVLDAFFIKGRSMTYSTILVRGAGSPIRGFGGIASGPEDLCRAVDNIQNILQRCRGKHLTSVDCLDVANIIAAAVVAGNIRRSACISIGDCDDIEYLRAKRWDLGGIPNWRAMSNNTVVCADVSDLPEEFWEGYAGNGEPYGLVNLDLARRAGRTLDGDKYPDPDVEGVNPCAEQTLGNYETCCLSEMFLPNIESFEQACDVATMAYRICKHSLMMPCHQPLTEEAVRKNMRMGISITGYMQASEQQRSWLPALYEYLRKVDVEYSSKLDVPCSVKLTTVKPSGTLSLLAGVTPGAHPGIYPFFIRRIRISATNALVDLCRHHGYDIEPQLNFDGTHDNGTLVISFPCRYPPGTRLARDMTAVDQLETVKELQRVWSDNAVSVTCYMQRHELPAIRAWLGKNYRDHVKSVSFLLHNDHGFKQAPYEEVSETEYLALVQKTIPVTSGSIEPDDEVDMSSECSKGVCPIK